MVEEDPNEYSDQASSADQEITLHIITGVWSLYTMQLQVLVAGKPILVVVDSCSTHSFINKATRLAYNQQPDLQVFGGQRRWPTEKVPSSRVCREVRLSTATLPYWFVRYTTGWIWCGSWYEVATNIGAHSVGFCFHHYVLQLGRTSGAVAGTKVEKKLRVQVYRDRFSQRLHWRNY